MTKPTSNFEVSCVTPLEVFASIKGLKSSKSTGVDNILSIFLKKIPRISTNAICHLINNIFRSAVFPDSLKISRILPPKKQGKLGHEMASYRPINNISVVDKIIEDIMKNQLENYFEKISLLLEGNHGGRHRHSTHTAHTSIQAINNKQMDMRKLNPIMCTDLSSAYNLIDIGTFDKKNWTSKGSPKGQEIQLTAI